MLIAGCNTCKNLLANKNDHEFVTLAAKIHLENHPRHDILIMEGKDITLTSLWDTVIEAREEKYEKELLDSMLANPSFTESDDALKTQPPFC